jgi:hypothetical protein
VLIKLEVCAESAGDSIYGAGKLYPAAHRINLNDSQTMSLCKLFDLVNIGGSCAMLTGVFLSTETRRNTALRSNLACGVPQVEAYLNNFPGINRTNMACARYRVSVTSWEFPASLMGCV